MRPPPTITDLTARLSWINWNNLGINPVFRRSFAAKLNRTNKMLLLRARANNNSTSAAADSNGPNGINRRPAVVQQNSTNTLEGNKLTPLNSSSLEPTTQVVSGPDLLDRPDATSSSGLPKEGLLVPAVEEYSSLVGSSISGYEQQSAPNYYHPDYSAETTSANNGPNNMIEQHRQQQQTAVAVSHNHQVNYLTPSISYYTNCMQTTITNTTIRVDMSSSGAPQPIQSQQVLDYEFGSHE